MTIQAAWISQDRQVAIGKRIRKGKVQYVPLQLASDGKYYLVPLNTQWIVQHVTKS